VILTLFVLACLVVVAHLVVGWRTVGHVPYLASLGGKTRASWPKVSIVIPARNEAAELEEALRSKLALDYPSLELVVVNDRSTDGTGAILDALAAEDCRIVPVHLDALPEGWLGKVHAMHRGIEASSGSFILLSDADIHFAPGSLRKAVGWALSEEIDHVTALPTVRSAGVLLQATLTSFLRILLVALRPWAVKNPASSASMGVGAFNLFRRSVYERTPGLEWLRMEVGDDVALGQMLKAFGAKSAVVNARGELSLRFYPSLRELTRHLEKSPGVGGHSPVLYLIAAVTIWILEVAPLVLALSPAAPPWMRAASSLLAVASIGQAMAMSRWLDMPWLPAVLTPVGVTILCALSLRASALAVLRGGIVWRDTFYPREALRAGGRYRLRRPLPGP